VCAHNITGARTVVAIYAEVWSLNLAGTSAAVGKAKDSVGLTRQRHTLLHSIMSLRSTSSSQHLLHSRAAEIERRWVFALLCETDDR
jgi:hypothetical protein